jgi:hypothetical protein
MNAPSVHFAPVHVVAKVADPVEALFVELAFLPPGLVLDEEGFIAVVRDIV